MGQLLFGLVLLGVAFFVRIGASAVRSEGARPVGGILRLVSLAALVVGVLVVVGSTNQSPLLAGIRMVPPWSSIERYSTREEQYPFSGDQVEEIHALSSEQMEMTVDVGLRWQIDPQQASHIYTEIGNEDQIHSAVRNAIRKGVRDGMVQYSINDISKRTQIASTMEALVDSALMTQPRVGGPRFRIATVTAFFLRDLQPPAQVVQAINNKIAQEQQVETERHRVEVARLQAEQQKLLNTTLTPEALTRQYFDVLRELKSSNNLVILVPTAGGIPVLNLGDLRRNLRP